MFAVLLSLALAEPGLSLPRTNLPSVEADASNASTFGMLEVEATQAAEVLLDGVKLGQLWMPGDVRFRVPAGPHTLRVYMQGQPNDLGIVVPSEGAVQVLAGRGGLSASHETETDDPAPAADVAVEFRVMGTRAATVHLDQGRHKVQPGAPLSFDLTPGAHPLSVRSADGAVIWASGVLRVSGSERVVVHVSEGRLPEVSRGGLFHTGSEG